MRARPAVAAALALSLAFMMPASAGSVQARDVPAVTIGAVAPGPLATASTVTCRWKWRWKKRVRWVERHGRKKRVVKYRKVKVKRCRTVTPPAPARLGVKAWEFGFTISAKEVEAGDTIIELNNQGEDDHNLHVQPVDGSEELATPDTDPGSINRVRLTTTPGAYRLWCSLPNHAVWGMDATFVATQGS